MTPLNIKDAEAHALASELAKLTGKSMTQAVKEALEERLLRERAAHSDHARLVARVLALGKRAASRPVLDSRSPDEILGYDEEGLIR